MIKCVNQIMKDITEDLESTNQNSYGEYYGVSEIYVSPPFCFYNAVCLYVIQENDSGQPYFTIEFRKYKEEQLIIEPLCYECELSFSKLKETIAHALGTPEIIKWIKSF